MCQRDDGLDDDVGVAVEFEENGEQHQHLATDQEIEPNDQVAVEFEEEESAELQEIEANDEVVQQIGWEVSQALCPKDTGSEGGILVGATESVTVVGTDNVDLPEPRLDLVDRARRLTAADGDGTSAAADVGGGGADVREELSARLKSLCSSATGIISFQKRLSPFVALRMREKTLFPCLRRPFERGLPFSSARTCRYAVVKL